jgi:hypothetical protein
VNDTLDRRAAIFVAITGLAVLFHSTGGVVVYEPATWKTALFIAALAGLIAALALAVLALAPASPRLAKLPSRELLLFWSAIAFVVALFLIAVAAGATAIDTLGGDEFELNG